METRRKYKSKLLLVKLGKEGLGFVGVCQSILTDNLQNGKDPKLCIHILFQKTFVNQHVLLRKHKFLQSHDFNIYRHVETLISTISSLLIENHLQNVLPSQWMDGDPNMEKNVQKHCCSTKFRIPISLAN